MIFFVHIPKCGGKSFRKGLEQAYGDDLLLYYNNPLKDHVTPKTGIFKTVHNLCFDLKNAKKKIVYGHYSLDEFLPLNNKSAGAFFRDPVEWVGSLLLYRQKKHRRDVSSDLLTEIREGDLEKGYDQFLGTYRPAQLDYVGLVEEYERSLRLFEKVFGQKIEYFHANKTEGAPKPYRDNFDESGILEEVTNLMLDNQSIYDEAKERFEALCKAHNV